VRHSPFVGQQKSCMHYFDQYKLANTNDGQLVMSHNQLLSRDIVGQQIWPTFIGCLTWV